MNEQPQLIAFYVNQLDPEKKQALLEQMPYTKQEVVLNTTVAENPFTQAVFDQLQQKMAS